MAEEEFRVESVRDEHHAVVIVAGELDAATGRRLHTELVDLCAAGIDRVVLDLRRLTFVDSFGLGVIVSAKKRLSGDGNSLCLVAEESQRSLRRILEITGLDQVLPIHTTVNDAVEDCLKVSAA